MAVYINTTDAKLPAATPKLIKSMADVGYERMLELMVVEVGIKAVAEWEKEKGDTLHEHWQLVMKSVYAVIAKEGGAKQKIIQEPE